MRPLALGFTLLVSGCFYGDDGEKRATPEQIIAAAKHCGVEDFTPTPVGDGYAAYVPWTVKYSRMRENCIYDTLRKQGLGVTR